MLLLKRPVFRPGLVGFGFDKNNIYEINYPFFYPSINPFWTLDKG
jgi:hypothetical protein